MSELDRACEIFDDAIAYQQLKGYPVYRSNDREAVAKAIEEKLHYTLKIGGQMACVFNIVYNDPAIWRQMDSDNAIYLHRVITNQDFKGQRLFQKVLDWTIARAAELDRPFVRMDTWADATNLIDYYTSFKFRVVELFMAPYDPQISENCQGNEVVLLEYKIS